MDFKKQNHGEERISDVPKVSQRLFVRRSIYY